MTTTMSKYFDILTTSKKKKKKKGEGYSPSCFGKPRKISRIKCKMNSQTFHK